MLLKLFLSLLAVFLPQGPEHSQPQEEYVPTPHGPQSAEEAAMAAKALHGKYYGGDMKFSDRWNTSDAGIKDENYRWTGFPGGAVIPIRLDESVNQYRDVIIQAIRAFHKHTCIRFKDWEGETDYVIVYYGDGCWSYIGKQGGPQYLSLGRGCGFVGTAVHEFLHCLGFYHTHQRSDRDNWLTVYKENVQEGREDQFTPTDPEEEVILVPYDYDSIMHYGNFAFSKAPNQLPTMVANNGQRLYEPYDKKRFTEPDLQMIKALYQC